MFEKIRPNSCFLVLVRTGGMQGDKTCTLPGVLDVICPTESMHDKVVEFALQSGKGAAVSEIRAIRVC